MPNLPLQIQNRSFSVKAGLCPCLSWSSTERMEGGGEEAMLVFLPLAVRSSTLFWPPPVVEALKAMSRGPDHSRVDSGQVLTIAISDMRASLSTSEPPLAPFAPQGYALYFDELISPAESRKWFGEILPKLANLLLRLPTLLEAHYQNAQRHGIQTSLRILGPQEAGLVLLSQELIAAFLACSFFCLFPVTKRASKRLPDINFDELFASLHEDYSGKQENKVMCIMHYFERICMHLPEGYVTFERKVLPLEPHPLYVSFPKGNLWQNSAVPLCSFEVCRTGVIEDQCKLALEVDFSNRYLGGGALHRGCVQEEIRFMTYPELITGMLFLPSMDDNEAIEIVGAERFSNYTGYASSFRYSGDYVDKRNVDCLGRRKSMIIAIDALPSPGMKQYKSKYLIREVNKAFCGFIDQSKYHEYKKLFSDNILCGQQQLEQDNQDHEAVSRNECLLIEVPASTTETHGEGLMQAGRFSTEEGNPFWDPGNSTGIATGNWGCGAFGGDPELKAMIQWLAASKALRPSISYYTFGLEALINLDQVSEWIRSHNWTVGDLWNMLTEYSSQRLSGETKGGFFAWLLPSLYGSERMELG